MDILFEPPGSNGVAGGPGATWELLEGQLAEDRIRLRVAVEPAAHGLPLASGPAILFVGMQADGGAGDVRLVEPIDTLVVETLPACDDHRCRYEAAIDLPTEGVMPAVRRLERNGMVERLSVNMTLVRTFAGGTWLQVLPLEGDNSQLQEPSDRLGSPWPDVAEARPVSELRGPQGPGRRRHVHDRRRLCGGVERRLASISDPSEPVATVPVSLHVTAGSGCDEAGVALTTDSGDIAFTAAIRGRTSFKRSFSIVPGVTWWLTVHDGWGIDDERRGGWGSRLGEIRTDGQPIAVEATLSCGPSPTGTITVTGTR